MRDKRPPDFQNNTEKIISHRFRLKFGRYPVPITTTPILLILIFVIGFLKAKFMKEIILIRYNNKIFCLTKSTQLIRCGIS